MGTASSLQRKLWSKLLQICQCRWEEAGTAEGAGAGADAGGPGQQRGQGRKDPQVRPHVWGTPPTVVSVCTARGADPLLAQIWGQKRAASRPETTH
jgi:hypothetical protein